MSAMWIMNYNRSTPEEVAEYIKLYAEGWSYPKIGRKFHKNHTSIIYWLRKKNEFISNRNEKAFFKKPQIEVKLPKPKPKPKDPTLCEVCGEKKNPCWKKTKFCSTACWAEVNKFKEKSIFSGI